MKIYRYHIHINGLVQGVGFRPFVYRIATELKLRGSVANNNDGVHIICHTSPSILQQLLHRIGNEAPAAASIESMHIQEEASTQETIPTGFSIANSSHEGHTTTRISPDIAICPQCLADRQKQPHRMTYPFTNCTNCGPRYTIIGQLPYDRPQTAMQPFAMCPTCRREYENPLDRRFHAQPIACNNCGPHYTARFGTTLIDDYTQLLQHTIETLSAGGVVALKGLGGYNLLCDAENERAVKRIRELKGRYSKPLAVMHPSIAAARCDTVINSQEEKMLSSWHRPIVLLKSRNNNTPWLNNGYRSLGVLLPYMAIHYDLFSSYKNLNKIVFTSCNATHTPIITDDAEAYQFCGKKVDGFISYNRDILNRIDDSVVHITHGKSLILRHSRGFTPEPTRIDTPCEGIWACGAQEIAQFAIGKGDSAILSPYIGALSYHENRINYHVTYQHYSRLFDFSPRLRVADLHPQYYTHHLPDDATPTLFMQHHHAHAVSGMAEHKLHHDVLALCIDGTGYGDDGRIWGGVLMRCNRTTYHVLRHLPFIATPNGDTTASRCWQSAAAWMNRYNITPPHAWVERIGERQIELYNRLSAGSNCIEWSSTGRLFDAVASITGITDTNRYSGEAPQLLEQAAHQARPTLLSLPELWSDKWTFLLQYICDSVTKRGSVATISATFHHAFATIWAEEIIAHAEAENLQEIILTGGAMQNKLLTHLLYKKLSDARLSVYLHSSVPCNDAGIAIGQLAYGAAMCQQP